uniref:Uncharacterized protein n=1 Tax=viral metagenome TaxID=1070528 RepID=A0A6M3IRI6_9ZZZZ
MMTDTEMLNMIEYELKHRLGGGWWWNVEHDVHAGATLREAVANAVAVVTQLTDYQKLLMKCTLNNSNQFGTAHGSDDSIELEKLAAAGLVTSEGHPTWIGDFLYRLYRLTPEGKVVVYEEIAKVESEP